MKESTVGYYQLSKSELDELWSKCVFIPDANVLLNLYRYPVQSRNDLLAAFKKISERLWLPHQAALEYQVNRLKVIAEQVRRFDEVEKSVNKVYTELKNDFSRLQLEKKHSLIEPGKLLDKLRGILDEFIEQLKDIKKEQGNVHGIDRIRDEIDALFANRVGGSPQSQDELDAIYEEGDRRFQQRRPPGYMDRDKRSQEDQKDIRYYNGLLFKREYGDLILWKQIKSEVENNNIKHVIFITDDGKEDWWWIVSSEGEKTIGPRPELVQEITACGVKLFHMYSSEGFLRQASEYLKLDVTNESIASVGDIARVDNKMQFSHRGMAAELAVYKWLYEIEYPHDTVSWEIGGLPEFIVQTRESGKTIGFEALLSNGRNVRSRIRDRIEEGQRMIDEGVMDEFYIVVVVEGDNVQRVKQVVGSDRNAEHVIIGKMYRDDNLGEEQVIFQRV